MLNIHEEYNSNTQVAIHFRVLMGPSSVIIFLWSVCPESYISSWKWKNRVLFTVICTPLCLALIVGFVMKWRKEIVPWRQLSIKKKECWKIKRNLYSKKYISFFTRIKIQCQRGVEECHKLRPRHGSGVFF